MKVDKHWLTQRWLIVTHLYKYVCWGRGRAVKQDYQNHHLSSKLLRCAFCVMYCALDCDLADNPFSFLPCVSDNSTCCMSLTQQCGNACCSLYTCSGSSTVVPVHTAQAYVSLVMGLSCSAVVSHRVIAAGLQAVPQHAAEGVRSQPNTWSPHYGCECTERLQHIWYATASQHIH